MRRATLLFGGLLALVAGLLGSLVLFRANVLPLPAVFGGVQQYDTPSYLVGSLIPVVGPVTLVLVGLYAARWSRQWGALRVTALGALAYPGVDLVLMVVFNGLSLGSLTSHLLINLVIVTLASAGNGLLLGGALTLLTGLPTPRRWLVGGLFAGMLLVGKELVEAVSAGSVAELLAGPVRTDGLQLVLWVVAAVFGLALLAADRSDRREPAEPVRDLPAVWPVARHCLWLLPLCGALWSVPPLLITDARSGLAVLAPVLVVLPLAAVLAVRRFFGVDAAVWLLAVLVVGVALYADPMDRMTERFGNYPPFRLICSVLAVLAAAAACWAAGRWPGRWYWHPAAWLLLTAAVVGGWAFTWTEFGYRGGSQEVFLLISALHLLALVTLGASGGLAFHRLDPTGVLVGGVTAALLVPGFAGFGVLLLQVGDGVLPAAGRVSAGLVAAAVAAVAAGLVWLLRPTAGSVVAATDQ